VRYLGIDKERSFGAHWRKWRTRNVGCRVCDARSFEGFENLSFAYSLFTFGFIPERDRPDLLRRLHDGLNHGGLFIMAEKVFANSAYFQDILTFDYYDFKRRRFSAEEILDKERSLRGQMNRWTEAEWLNALFEAGFQPEQVHPVWQNHLFIAWMARKEHVTKVGGHRPREDKHCAPGRSSKKMKGV
jgi:tRNA (cmo5U34)-methyltransferase